MYVFICIVQLWVLYFYENWRDKEKRKYLSYQFKLTFQTNHFAPFIFFSFNQNLKDYSSYFHLFLQLLWERFKEFARDTEAIGSERVQAVNDIADQLIAVGHSDSACIAEWKDGLNEAWQDLLELIETRTQMLAASRELHKFFHDCKDVLSRILEKQNAISDEFGRDAGSVSTLQRKHQNFVQDLLTLQSQVWF